MRVRQEVMGIIETVSDLSYGWDVINDFMSILHTRVKRDPSCVILLRVRNENESTDFDALL